MTGTGLGLTITRLLTKIMGGDIGVTSRSAKAAYSAVKILLSEVFNPRTTSVMEDNRVQHVSRRAANYHGRR